MTQPTLEHLAHLDQRLAKLLEPAIRFWKSTVDWERGGFFGEVDYEGRPLENSDKHTIQQVRHLWTFSEIYKFKEPSPEIAEICHHQFAFVRDRLYLPTDREFCLSVSPDGSSREIGTNHYLLAFAIFALSNYSMAFPGTKEGLQALEMAKDVFFKMKKRSFHRRHGFDERVYPYRWCRDDKEINTQMHLLEAVTYLFEATKTSGDKSEKAVRKVLNTQLNLVAFKGIAERGGIHFCSRGYRRGWQVVNDWEVDCGHDIENVYLTMLAAKALGREGDPELREQVVKLGRGATTLGFDAVLGKWYYSADPRNGAPRERVSNIWTNFEALNGLATIYELTGEDAYLEKFGRVLSWLESKQINEATKEWYYNVDDQGQPVDEDVFGNPCHWMTFSWKSSYHSLRAIMTRMAWIREQMTPPPSIPDAVEPSS